MAGHVISATSSGWLRNLFGPAARARYTMCVDPNEKQKADSLVQQQTPGHENELCHVHTPP